MAELVGLVASVIQVAGAGLKLSQTLYQYADAVATADRRIRDIAKEIQLTSFVIEELGTIFGNDETAALLSKNAIQTAAETMKECSDIFVEIEATLKKSKKNTLGKYLLPFRDSKIELLRLHIDKLKSTLQLLMQVLTHAHQIAAKRLDREAEAKQRAQIQELLDANKKSTKIYEESLRNFGDDSTVLDDSRSGSERASTLDLAYQDQVSMAYVGSSINVEALGTCVTHIRSLLQDIEVLQRALSSQIDGEDHSAHHQNVFGSYLRTREHLDSVFANGKASHGFPTEQRATAFAAGNNVMASQKATASVEDTITSSKSELTLDLGDDLGMEIEMDLGLDMGVVGSVERSTPDLTSMPGVKHEELNPSSACNERDQPLERRQTSFSTLPASESQSKNMEMSARERRKLQQQERLFKQISYDEEHKGKKGKRNSAGSSLDSPGLSYSQRMGHTEPSPSVRYREHSNSIARKTSSSSTKTNDRTASESKPLYKEEFTQTEDSDTTRSNSIPKSSAKTGVQGGSMNMRFKNLVGSKRKSSAGNPSPAIDAATLRIPPAYAFAPSPLIAPRERLAHNPSPPMIVHDTSNDKYHSYTPSLAPQQANWTQDMISTTESYEPGTGQGRDPAIVREGGTESVMDTSEERSNGENEVDQLLRDWTNISHKNRSTAAGI